MPYSKKEEEISVTGAVATGLWFSLLALIILPSRIVQRDAEFGAKTQEFRQHRLAVMNPTSYAHSQPSISAAEKEFEERNAASTSNLSHRRQRFS